MDDYFKNSQQEFNDKVNERKFKRRIEDLKKLIQMPEGRRFIWELLMFGGIYQCGFVEDSNKLYYLSGKREIVKVLLDNLNIADPNVFSKMQAEYYSELKSEETIAKQYKDKDIKEDNDV